MRTRLNPTGELGTALRETVAAMLESGVPSAGRLVAAAGLSLRTLQRRLAAESTSFSALLEDVRREQAPQRLAAGAGDYVLTTTGAGAATGTLAGVADRVDLFRFVPRADLSIDRLSVNVTTAVAVALGKVVFYASNAAGQPAGLLAKTGTLEFSTTGVKEATVALTFRKGVTYWLGIRHSSTATLCAWVANATPDLTVTAPTTQQRKVPRRMVTFATAAPNPCTHISSKTANAVATAIWLRSA